MSEWLDFTVYAVLMAAVWFVLPAWAGRFSWLYLQDRNPEWVRSHAELARVCGPSAGFRVTCGAWGAFSIGALLMLQLDMWPGSVARITAGSPRWEALKDLNSLLLIVGVAGLLSAAALLRMRAHTVVPQANVRRAALERRTINEVVSRPIRLAVYGFTAAVVTGWLAAAATGSYSTPRFWGRFVFLIITSLIAAAFVRISVRRPPQVMDRILGPAFRASETRVAFAQQLLFPTIGAVRLYQEVAGTEFVDLNRAMHLGVALLVTGWVLWLSRWYVRAGDASSGDPRSGATLRWSTP